MVKVIWNPSMKLCMGKAKGMTKSNFLGYAKSEYLRLTGEHLEDETYNISERPINGVWTLEPK